MTTQQPSSGGDRQTSTAQAAGQVIDQVQEKAGQVIDQVQEKAGQAVDQVQEQTTSLLTSRKTQAVEGLKTSADALHQTSGQLRQQGHETIGEYADLAARQIEQLSGYLRDRDLQQVVGEAEEFARQHPALFVGGAAALGLLAARFLKSSRGESSGSQVEGGGDGRGGPVARIASRTARSRPETAPNLEGGAYRVEAGLPSSRGIPR